MKTQHPIPSDSIRSISDWHALARPEHDAKALAVQLGCHFEEVAEMLETVTFTEENFHPILGTSTLAYEVLCALAHHLKNGESDVTITDRPALLDSMADQVVTAVGVAHCAGMDFPPRAGRGQPIQLEQVRERHPGVPARRQDRQGRVLHAAGFDGLCMTMPYDTARGAGGLGSTGTGVQA